MPFNYLLLTALEPNLRIRENKIGIKVQIAHSNTETVLLFKPDGSSFHNGYLNEFQPECSTPSCCDAICFYYRKYPVKPKIVICLAELKGGSKDQTKKACDQILKTYDAIKADLKKKLPEITVTYKAVIISNSSMLDKDIERILKPLKDKLKDQNVRHISRKEGYEDLADFLRK
jgi:hypothetical protein